MLAKQALYRLSLTSSPFCNPRLSLYEDETLIKFHNNDSS
jgi:hypothetical protein